jgi:hypothetical protein
MMVMVTRILIGSNEVVEVACWATIQYLIVSWCKLRDDILGHWFYVLHWKGAVDCGF